MGFGQGIMHKFFCEIERDILELGKGAEILEASHHTNGFGL